MAESTDKGLQIETADMTLLDRADLTAVVLPSVGPLPAVGIAALLQDLEGITTEAEHYEMWGVKLLDGNNVPTLIVLEKFLRANSMDVVKAKAQLIEALKWRKQIDPAKLLAEKKFNRAKFGALGYVTVYQSSDAHGKEVISWNIYGAVKDLKSTFEDVDEFIEWRAALMELSVQQLDLPSATEPIPADGEDPYKMIQVHDYLNVSFLRQDPSVKAASKKTIQVFAMAYPELLKEKFFVNVPLLMGWMFTAVKLFVNPATVKKFHPLSYGSSLAGELPALASELPSVYGGKGKAIEDDSFHVTYAESEVTQTPLAVAGPSASDPAVDTVAAESKSKSADKE